MSLKEFFCLISFFILLVFFIALLCSEPANSKRIGEISRGTSDATIQTIVHDGHKWVVMTSYKSGGILHHPDCGCDK